MSSSFELTVYLSKRYHYAFTFPVGSNKQNYEFRQELGMSNEEYEEYELKWKKLEIFEKDKFLKTLNNNDFAFISELHSCRESALAKGLSHASFLGYLNMVYRQGFLTLTYPDPIPVSFRDLITQTILKPYGVNGENMNIICDLEKSTFGIGMNPGYWNKAWLGLLTYFAKYGDYLEYLGEFRHLADATLDQTIHAILDSWSGQVGMYTAFGLWSWANKDETAIHSDWDRFNGIHNAMDNYTTLYAPNKLFEFLIQYHLGLDRCSRLFVANHQYLAQTHSLQVPYWFKQGDDNDNHLSESPEWNDYMGYDDEDGYQEDYDDHDEPDYDFEEDW